MPQAAHVANRRRFLSGAATALAGLSLASGRPAHAGETFGAAEPGSGDEQPPPRGGRAAAPVAGPKARKRPPGKIAAKAIASANGLEATKLAYQMMQQGEDPLDAVVAGVTLVEDDPNDTSVGYGGLPNENGVVELDAAVMHGPTHQAGAVASLQNIRNPAKVAQLVMQQTDHVLLVGEGALQFAKAMGFKEQDLLTERARKIWLHWKQTHSDQDDWLPPPADQVDPEVAKFFQRPTGTIHCAAINGAGDISCVTSTSGLAFKIPGRVGDLPIIGAGLYVDNEIGSCGSTGRGEANLVNLCSFMGVELMQRGMSPVEAGLELLRGVVRHTVPRLLDEQGKPTFNLKFYLLDKEGGHAGVSMWGPSWFAVTDGQGTRSEPCATLYQRKTSETGQ